MWLAVWVSLWLALLHVSPHSEISWWPVHLDSSCIYFFMAISSFPPSWSFSASLYLGLSAAVRSPAFLSPLPSHRLSQCFIDQSEMMENNFYIIQRVQMLDQAIGWTVDRPLGIEISIWIYSAQGQPLPVYCLLIATEWREFAQIHPISAFHYS